MKSLQEKLERDEKLLKMAMLQLKIEKESHTRQNINEQVRTFVKEKLMSKEKKGPNSFMLNLLFFGQKSDKYILWRDENYEWLVRRKNSPSF